MLTRTPFNRIVHSLPIGNRMDGKVVTIINRSEIVGRPLGALLANDGGCFGSRHAVTHRFVDSD